MKVRVASISEGQYYAPAELDDAGQAKQGGQKLVKVLIANMTTPDGYVGAPVNFPWPIEVSQIGSFIPGIMKEMTLSDAEV